MNQDYQKAKLIAIRNGKTFHDCEYLTGHRIILIQEQDDEYLVPFEAIDYIKKVKE